MGCSVKRGVLGWVLVAGVLMISPQSANAENAEPDYGRTGAYLGAGLGVGFEQFDGIFGAMDFDTALGVDAWLGYRVHPNIAAEIQVEYLTGSDGAIGAVGFEGNGLTFTGNLKGYVGSGRVQPFALVGIGFKRVDVEGPGLRFDDLDFATRMGLGVDFHLSEAISFETSASYVMTYGDIDGFDHISWIAAMQYRF